MTRLYTVGIWDFFIAFFKLVCHFEEREISASNSAPKRSIFVEFLTKISLPKPRDRNDKIVYNWNLKL